DDADNRPKAGGRGGHAFSFFQSSGCPGKLFAGGYFVKIQGTPRTARFGEMDIKQTKGGVAAGMGKALYKPVSKRAGQQAGKVVGSLARAFNKLAPSQAKLAKLLGKHRVKLPINKQSALTQQLMRKV
ncbi:MAG: hypothetical protein HYR60_29000, partial [Acidobacteria bacterium]|nr:hypothetical protein [Acidobacteriota bacterium]